MFLIEWFCVYNQEYVLCAKIDIVIDEKTNIGIKRQLDKIQE